MDVVTFSQATENFARDWNDARPGVRKDGLFTWIKENRMDLLTHFKELTEIPKGWVSRAQLAEASGLSESAVRVRMQKLNVVGKLVRGAWWYPPTVEETHPAAGTARRARAGTGAGRGT